MARPKEKIPTLKAKSFHDRCQNEKDLLKQSITKQLQKDMGNLLNDDLHCDLTIMAGGLDIKVHRFILKSRCPAIFDRFVELSTGEDMNVLVMPSWLTYNTVLFIIRKLYFVETDPLDEAVDKQDEVLMDYLRSLLIQRKSTDGSSSENETDLQNLAIGIKENGTNVENLPFCETNAMKSNSYDSVLTQPTVKDNGEENDVLHLQMQSSTVNGTTDHFQEQSLAFCDNTCKSVDSQNENLDFTRRENRETTESDNLMSGETTDNSEQIESVSSLIKLSYGLSLPYEACNRVGEDLLRGYLQEIDTDCQITVSGDHFKVHKCILAARSSYFAAMLGGSWKESDTDINLEGVTPSAVEQLLLYLYGGVVDIIDSCTVEELVLAGDMYGLDGVKSVVISYLKREYCHMFHKICSLCEELVPEALTIAMAFHMDLLRDKCVEWINRNMVKMWRSRFLGKQPQETLDLCYQKAVEELNRETAIETLLNCQNLNHNIPRLRWSEPLLCLITKLNDAAIEFISCNFIGVLKSAAFHELDQGIGYKISLLEEIFEAVIKSLPINKACEVYHSLLLKNIQTAENAEHNLWSMDYCNFINFLFTKCEDFLKLHVHQVINMPGWELLSKDTQTKLLEGGHFLVLNKTITDVNKPAKVRPEPRRNYVPKPLVRKENKTLNSRVSTSRKSKSAREIPADSILRMSTNQVETIQVSEEIQQREAAMDTMEQREVTEYKPELERDLQTVAVVYGASSNDTSIARNIEEFFYNFELPEAITFSVEFIPIITFTFQPSE